MATYTRPYSEADGAIGEASSVNKYIDDLVSTVNNINSANLVTSAVTTDSIQDSAVTTVKIAGSAVTPAKIANDSIPSTKLDHSTMILIQEVI